MLYQLPLPPKYTTQSSADLRAGIRRFKEKLGKRLCVLGHHYQQDDVIEFADFTGDSLKLSVLGSQQHEAEFIVFCGVHFMAESADILAQPHQQVILPDLSAGCSMADMAHIDQVEESWPLLESHAGSPITPITYVNSSAAVKAFVGRKDGACCTSSNARMVLEWALHGATPDQSRDREGAGVGKGSLAKNGDQSGRLLSPPASLRARLGSDSPAGLNLSRDLHADGHKVMFLPDQHLGRNTAHALGWPLESMVVYDPKQPDGGLRPDQRRMSQFFLWKGHCSVHQLFNTKQVAAIRAMPEPYKILVHPECPWEVCQQADIVGSTEYIIRCVRESPPGSYWAIGTEVHLIQRLAAQYPDRHVRSLAGIQCLCTTMYRIDLPHLYWVLENLCEGRVVNRVHVDDETKRWARIALDRMLELRPAKPIAAR